MLDDDGRTSDDEGVADLKVPVTEKGTAGGSQTASIRQHAEGGQAVGSATGGRRKVRGGLGLVCLIIFALLLGAQILTGWREHDNDARTHHQHGVAIGTYLTTGHFVEATFENWESEFLQMAAYILLTVWFVQRGSAESKDPAGDAVDEDPRAHRNDPDAPWPVRRGGLWLRLYENSLLIAFGVLFLASIVGHALGGTAEYNSEGRDHGESPVSTLEFVRTSSFWFQSFQNWQSEFLAVASIVGLTVVLRQRGSAESKPVHAPNAKTGSS